VPLYHLMEDAATAEISRAQVWQWIRHKAKLADGRVVDLPLCRTVLDEELQKLKAAAGDEAWTRGRYHDAAQLFLSLIEAPHFPEWLTIPAYDKILAEGA
jgi:malate synthase